MIILANTKKTNTQSGFTLIELSIVILIVGLLVVPLLQLYQGYIVGKYERITKDNIASSVSNMSGNPARYPCPSDRSLAVGNANYGVENCVLATIPACTNPGLQGICQAVSLRDADGNGTNDVVIIGGIPLKLYTTYTALGAPVATSIEGVGGVTFENRLDGWNNQLTYAVPFNLANPLKANAISDFKLGVISAVDELLNPTAGVNDDAQFAIVSHGRAGAGAFTSNGVIRQACNAATRESENCDEDTVFMSAIGLYEGNSPNYFDDYASFFSISANDIWYNIQVGATTTQHITNRNTQNVGVNLAGTPAATMKLDVNGTIRADTIRADSLCGPTSASTSFCLSPTLLGGMVTRYGAAITPGVTYCNDGQIVEEISTGAIKCGYPTFDGPPNTTRNCPAGRYVREVLTNGCIVCNDGSKICT